MQMGYPQNIRNKGVMAHLDFPLCLSLLNGKLQGLERLAVLLLIQVYRIGWG